MNGKNLKAFSIRVNVCNVHRVTVSKTCGIETLSIVVNGTGPVNNFVFAVAIDIGNAEIMSSLSNVQMLVSFPSLKFQAASTVRV